MQCLQNQTDLCALRNLGEADIIQPFRRMPLLVFVRVSVQECRGCHHLWVQQLSSNNSNIISNYCSIRLFYFFADAIIAIESQSINSIILRNRLCRPVGYDYLNIFVFNNNMTYTIQLEFSPLSFPLLKWLTLFRRCAQRRNSGNCVGNHHIILFPRY